MTTFYGWKNIFLFDCQCTDAHWKSIFNPFFVFLLVFSNQPDCVVGFCSADEEMNFKQGDPKVAWIGIRNILKFLRESFLFLCFEYRSCDNNKNGWIWCKVHFSERSCQFHSILERSIKWNDCKMNQNYTPDYLKFWPFHISLHFNLKISFRTVSMQQTETISLNLAT